MTRVKLPIAALLLIAFFIPQTSYSQPEISGDLTGTLGPGEFIVVGNCEVPAGETLTLQPGTSFLFSGLYSVSIYGELHADGTETDSIRFTRLDPIEEHRHQGLRFQTGASANSTLAYCVIEYTNNQVFPNYHGGAIYSSGVPIRLTDSRISYCNASWGGAIYINGAQLIVEDCLVTDCNAIGTNSAGGFQLIDCVDSEVHSTIFARNGAGGT